MVNDLLKILIPMLFSSSMRVVRDYLAEITVS